MADLVGVKFEERTVKVKHRDLCTPILGMIFKLEPKSIYITQEPDGELFIADDAGRFHVNDLVYGAEYRVHGDSVDRVTNHPTGTVAFSAPANSSTNLAAGVAGAGRTRFNPPPTKRPRFTSQASSSQALLCRPDSWKKAFMHIEVDEKGNIQEKFQLHLVLREETASVDNVKTMLKEQLGYDVALLDSKHLPILSNELTKGALFWKSARKILVVKDDQLEHLNKGKKPRGRKPTSELILEELSKFLEQRSSPPAAQSSQPVAQSSPSAQTTEESLKEMFRCTICLMTAMLPAACCSKCFCIIGCIPCVEQWIESSLSIERCPLYRTSAPFNTIPLVRSIAVILGQEVPNGTSAANTLETFDNPNNDEDEACILILSSMPLNITF